MNIRSADELRTLIMKVMEEQKSQYAGTIEEYLRSVWSCILSHQNEAPTYNLFGEILQKAFTQAPASFENKWKKYKSPPQELQALLAPEKPLNRGADFACLRGEILFQIAELRRMKDYGRDKMKHFGVISPTGHAFYNWDPFTYLERATAGLVSSKEGGLLRRVAWSRCNWSFARLPSRTRPDLRIG